MKKGDNMENIYLKVPRLIHCFGNEKNIVRINMVIEMLESSKNNIVPINTHNIDNVEEWDLLPIGYGDANWRELSERMDTTNYIPVWNINLQNSAEEVIRRTLKAVEMGGKRAVKLEVLDSNHKWSINDEVVKATKKLMEQDLEIWPLIAPEKETIDELLDLKCPMIRILGSEISSGNGISDKTINAMKYIKSKSNTKVMLDGGVGKAGDVYKALIEGFDSVLVNSYLFKEHSPAEELDKIVNAKVK